MNIKLPLQRRMMYQDIYFLNSKEAIKIAKEQNKFGNTDVKYNLQCCYYNGEKVESDLANLFHLPIENLLDGLAYGRHRIPSNIDFSGLEISNKLKIEILTYFNMTIEQAKEYRKKINLQYIDKLKSLQLNFDEPLRFYLMASASTTVIQFVSKNIADALQEMGYEVFFDLLIGTEDAASFQRIYEYKPHATININNINNSFLSEDMYNFIWFQDPMSILTDGRKIDTRQRDYFFHILNSFDNLMKKNGIDSQYQSFCLNNKIYKKLNTIKKEKKIVFIGSSYAFRIKNLKNQHDFKEVYSAILALFESKSCLTSLAHENSDIQYLMKKYKKTELYINDIYAYLSRDYCVEKLCSIDTNYDIEIYGSGWENNDIVKPYFKGILQYGEDITKVYNSATYGYCPGAYVIMQRTLECAFSETIPLVLDVRKDLQDTYDKRVEDAIEFFKIKDLEQILQKEPSSDKRYDFIKEQYSYKHFANRCIQIIKDDSDA